MSGDTDKLVGSLVGGKYKVIARVGEGGMGALYLAQHAELGRSVAVKVMVETLARDEKYLKRFKQEAKLAAALSHPNVAHVYDYGQLESGAPYLVMDFLEGQTLASLLVEKQFLCTAEAVPVLQQVCKGLQHAHSRGMVHRDLKPSNIMLIQTDGETVVKILDFGIAKEVDNTQGLTQTGELFGSPLYMSPEQCSGQQVDARSDIYSLGCLTYEALTGQVPLRGESIVQTIFKHMHESAPPMKAVCPQCDAPAQVEAVINKAMAKNRDDRFQTASEFGEQLKLAASAAPALDERTLVQADRQAQPVTAAATPAQNRSADGTATKGGGIVISPVAGLAILAAAVLIGGAAVMLTTHRTPPPTPASLVVNDTGSSAAPLTQAEEQEAAAEKRAEAAEDRAAAAEDKADAAAEETADAEHKAELKRAYDSVTQALEGSFEKNSGETNVQINGSGLQVKSPEATVSLNIPGLTSAGSVSAGANQKLINAPVQASPRKWKRDNLSNPLITWTNPSVSTSPQVHVVYAHQAFDQGFSQDNDYLHIGHIQVNVSQRSAPVVLVLVGYAPIVWNVRAQPGVKIEKVILGGLHQQKVTGLPRWTQVVESSERLPPGPDDPRDYYQQRPNPAFTLPTISLLSGEDVASNSSFVELSQKVKQLAREPIMTFQYCGKEKEFNI